MRVAYATIYDATTTASGFGSYNGVGYHMGRALSRAGAKLDYIGPLRETFAGIFYPKQQVIQKWAKKGYNRHRETLVCKDYSRQIAQHVRQTEPDLVLSSLSVGSQPVAYLSCPQPIVIWTDSTLASAVGFYPDLCREKTYWPNLESGLRNEAEALQRAALVIYSSDWARREAIKQYGLDPRRVKVVPFGANDLHAPDAMEVDRLIATRPRDLCRLLFVGMDWKRKGGDMALAVAAELHRRGVPVELTLVGGAPDDCGSLPRYVKPHGLITRRTAEGANRLAELFGRSHFLILPSRADASPHVLVEANSYGVPCAASDVGGIPSIISPGRNGETFAAVSDPSEYAKWIEAVFSDSSSYQALARSSFAEYDARLNWSSAGRQVAGLLHGLIGEGSRVPDRLPQLVLP